MTSAITAAHAAKRIIKTLKAAGSPDRAAQSHVYFKDYEDVRFYGLAVPEVRAVEREFFASVKGVWTLEDALNLCDLLIREPQLESKQIGIEVLARFKRQFTAGLLDNIKGWLADDHCSNWATTDCLCSLMLAPLIQQHPELIEGLKRWARDENLWVRRASAVPLTGLARRGQQLDDAYEIAEALFDYPEDLIHKATGWLLRDAGKTDPARLEAFLLSHGPRIPRTALRYAIENFLPEKRKLLLRKTKAMLNRQN
jgi:3-methyladenine DNA glycosylase AlkD